jgi:GT2 family glycosyltransferase
MYTIVITCKDKPTLLMNVLEKIESKYPIQIIVFDIDAENNCIEKICNNYNKFELRRIATNKMGMAACLDMGISVAKYENVIYCQDDIVPIPFCFDKLYEIYKGQSEYFMLSPNIEESNKLDGEGIKKIFRLDNYSGRIFACFIINKTNYFIAGRLDINFYPVYYEDRDFLYRITLLGKKFGAVTDIIIKHNAGSTIRVMDSFTHDLSKNHEYYIKKWGGPPDKEVFTIPFNGKEASKW